MRGKRISMLLLILIISRIGFGQDVSFSQFYSNPVYLNPAFSGSEGIPRIALQYRNQWQSFSNAFTTYSAAFDFPIKKLQGGIGFNFMNDVQAGGLLVTQQLNAAYSVYIRLSEEFMLLGGLQAGYSRNSLNTADLVFADNVDINYGSHGVSQELATLTDPNYGYADFSTGVLMYNKRLFFGIAAHHLTEPQQSFYIGENNSARLKRKYTAHIGARLPVYLHGHNRKKFDISPHLIIQHQGISDQINYGIFVTKRGLTGGVWFRQNFEIRYDSAILLFGFVKRNWQFMYSYDWTISGLRGDSGGTSEVSLTFLLRKSEDKKVLPFSNQYHEEFGVQ